MLSFCSCLRRSLFLIDNKHFLRFATMFSHHKQAHRYNWSNILHSNGTFLISHPSSTLHTQNLGISTLVSQKHFLFIELHLNALHYLTEYTDQSEPPRFAQVPSSMDVNCSSCTQLFTVLYIFLTLQLLYIDVKLLRTSAKTLVTTPMFALRRNHKLSNRPEMAHRQVTANYRYSLTHYMLLSWRTESQWLLTLTHMT